MTEFDQASNKFTKGMIKATNWKHNYYGASYTSRLIEALQEARDCCDKLEAELERLGELR